MTKTEARKLIKAHKNGLNTKLEKATSQFQVKMCYVNAHDELEEIAKGIIDKLSDS